MIKTLTLRNDNFKNITVTHTYSIHWGSTYAVSIGLTQNFQLNIKVDLYPRIYSNYSKKKMYKCSITCYGFIRIIKISFCNYEN